MSKRLCLGGLLLVLFAGSPALAQFPQAERVSSATTLVATLLPNWLEGLLDVVAGGGTATSPDVAEEVPNSPPRDTQLPSTSLTGEEGTTERGPGMEPGG